MTRRFRDCCTLYSLCFYLFWRAIGSWFSLLVRLRSGIRLILRPPPSHDLVMAKEVFALKPYSPPHFIAMTVGGVVDLGAIVGYSCLYWLRTFPNARVLAFEP